MVNWDKVLCRSSCAGKVMTEGKGSVFTDTDKNNLKKLTIKNKALTPKQSITLSELIKKRDQPPSLSDTCISYLKEVYEFHKYGKQPIGGAKRSKAVEKGNLCEDDSIFLLNRFYQTENLSELQKNNIRENNDYITGEADIIWRRKDTTIDTKSVWDMQSLLKHVPNPQKPDLKLYDEIYVLQGQCYMDLFKTSYHTIAYVLVNMPQEYINDEKYKLFRKGNFATEENIEYKQLCQELENNCCFDDIDISERLVTFTFAKDKQQIDALYTRWEQCRKWLKEFEKIHTSLNKRL